MIDQPARARDFGQSRPHAGENPPFLLTTSSPGRSQRRLAVCVLVVLVGALVVTAPFARIPLENTEALLPAYAAAVFVNEVITASLLLALFSVQRSRAVFALSIGYLFSGVMVIPWALTFPGVFESLGLPDAGLQSTAAIATLRRLGFPIFVLAYALLEDSGSSARVSHGSARSVILAGVAGVVAIACGSTWLIVTSDDALPGFMKDTRNVAAPWQYVPATAVCLYLVGLCVLWIRPRSVLNLWLMVVLCTLLIEIVILSYLSAGLRLSLGWWAGRLYGLLSASLVLLVLLSEKTTLYARLVRSVSAERRAREARLTAMEALSASIAHEVNQPLASMVTNADAGLRWLGRQSPNVDEARAALKRIVDDGHRAAKVIEGITTMFKKGAQERVSVNMNRLIEETLRRCRDEARLGRISVQAELDADLPPVMGSPVQLQQVISNLVANAIDAMTAVAGRKRVICIRSARRNSDAILVSVEDSGTGLDPKYRDRIFEPFFTTRSDGMGMGLMFCQSVIEAHGGRLWVTDNEPHGAIFHFTLPSADDPPSTAGATVR
ncbi:ATP-binding protein [Azospirillum halopraeferens]|uniref:ATP-binding protein n=1 Tax=Azospirillum halopraeferens TaxID=34010 RepID=UPI000A00F47E|nr:ATP-binding protein [Azospirillum halopraeferens]